MPFILWLIMLLGHDNFHMRESAQTALLVTHLYVDITPYLPTADKDLERRARAIELAAICHPYPGEAPRQLTQFQWHTFRGHYPSAYYTFRADGSGSVLWMDSSQQQDFSWHMQDGSVLVAFPGLPGTLLHLMDISPRANGGGDSLYPGNRLSDPKK